MIVILHAVEYRVIIIILPFTNPVPGTNNTFEYPAGTDLTVVCWVIPATPSGSEFNWNCSTGCFADMEMQQFIFVTEAEGSDSGELSCSMSINGMEYFSELVELEVIEGMFVFKLFVVRD